MAETRDRWGGGDTTSLCCLLRAAGPPTSVQGFAALATRSLCALCALCLLMSGFAGAQTQRLPDSPGTLVEELGTLGMQSETPAQASDPQIRQDSGSAGAPAGQTAAAQTKDLPDAETGASSQARVAAQNSEKTVGQGADTTPAQSKETAQEASDQRASAQLPPCPMPGLHGQILFLPGESHDPCQEENQLQYIVESGHAKPLSASQKGALAVRGVVDPFNLLSMAFFSSLTIAENAHTAYGPGYRGAGSLMGYSLLGDIQGEFLGTYFIPALTHEDPRYRRLPGAPITRRILHAVLHTFVTQHDDGSVMPNYSVLIGYPAGNELANLYVPGLAVNGPSTAKRIVLGIATDPVGQIIAEFLPDVARRIHIHVIFVQQILNQVALDPNATQ